MSSEYMPQVIQAIPGPDKTVYAYFSDGRITQYDAKPLIEKGGVFSSLQDNAFFDNALTVLNDTVAWDVSGDYDATSCIDIDPWAVYESRRVTDPLETAA